MSSPVIPCVRRRIGPALFFGVFMVVMFSPASQRPYLNTASAQSEASTGNSEQPVEEAVPDQNEDGESPPTFGDLDPEASLADCAAGPDPSEIALLEALRKRRQDIDRREAEVRRKEEIVAQLEREMSRRVREAVAEVKRLEKRLELGEYERKAREEKLNTLASSIGSLRPSKAAPILERTDPILTVILLMHVGPKRAGELLAKMEPRRAAALMDRLARGRSAAQLAAALVTPPRRRKKGRQ